MKYLHQQNVRNRAVHAAVQIPARKLTMWMMERKSVAQAHGESPQQAQLWKRRCTIQAHAQQRHQHHQQHQIQVHYTWFKKQLRISKNFYPNGNPCFFEGGDFKCEEEGFYPHPRDCKKYFWCLDSGPSNLGIVAHQFTCPSGLVFNKLTDSCDYTRNVLCEKPKSTTTTEP